MNLASTDVALCESWQQYYLVIAEVDKFACPDLTILQGWLHCACLF